MAKITVRLYATFREAAGESMVSLEADNLDGLLEQLRESSPELAKAIAMTSGLVILVNGRNVREEGKPLSDGDEVAVFPPVSGG